jgi:head-tail adaptor
MSTGALRDRLAFQAPNQSEDAAGQVNLGHALAFTIWGRVQRMRGGEGTLGARLEGRTPAIIRVRASTKTRAITAGWLVSEGTETFNIRERPRETDDRLFLEFLAESGVGT